MQQLARLPASSGVGALVDGGVVGAPLQRVCGRLPCGGAQGFATAWPATTSGRSRNVAGLSGVSSEICARPIREVDLLLQVHSRSRQGARFQRTAPTWAGELSP